MRVVNKSSAWSTKKLYFACNTFLNNMLGHLPTEPIARQSLLKIPNKVSKIDRRTAICFVTIVNGSRVCRAYTYREVLSVPNRGESAPRFGKRDERILVTRAMVCSCFGALACQPKSCSAFSPQFQYESPISLTPNRYLGAMPPDLACYTAGPTPFLGWRQRVHS